MSGDRPAFAKGGFVPGASCDGDRVPAFLLQGCPLLSREQAEAMGLTADAKRLRPECICGTMAALNRGETHFARSDIICPACDL